MSAALVPFVASAAPYARTAARAASFAYGNRQYIYSAARAIRQRYAKKQLNTPSRDSKAKAAMRASGRMPNRVPRGNPNVVGSGQAEDIESTQTSSPQTWTDVFIGKLQGAVIPAPAIGTAEGTRQKASVFVRKLNICRTFYYRESAEAGSDAGPVMLRYAVIQIKDTSGKSNDLATAIAYAKLGFFRNPAYSTRTANFNDMGTSSSTWDDGYNCLPMNGDEAFKILYQTRFMLQAGNAYNDSMNRSIAKVEKNITINKNLDFEFGSAGLFQRPIIEVWWYMSVRPEAFPTASPGAVAYVRTYATTGLDYAPSIKSLAY